MLKRERLNESDRRVPADYNVYEPDIYEKTAVFAVEAIFCLIVGYLFYGTWITVLAAPAAFMPALKLYSENMIRKRRRELLISFRDFISRISSSFAGGRQMTESIEEAASDIFQGADKKNIMALEAGNMLNLIRSGNMTDLEALTDFARRADMEDIYNFVRVYRSCRTKGGDMISTISKSVMMINDKIQIEHDIESMMTQRKLEGGLITLMPFLVILLMKFSSPTYMDIMYGSLQGRLIMTGALGGIAAAYLMIRKIMEIRI